jgi:anti-repressor protein
MSNIIKFESIIENDDGNKIMSARELWEGLKRPYGKFTSWFDTYKSYGFIEGIDYNRVFIKINTPKSGLQNATDYEITIDMGKHLAMLQKTDLGFKIRQYLIEVEKATRKEFSLKESLELNLKLLEEKLKIEEAKEKVTSSFYKTRAKAGGLKASNNRKDKAIRHKENLIKKLQSEIVELQDEEIE